MRLKIDLKTLIIISAVIIASINVKNQELLIITASITVLFILSSCLVRKLLS